MGVLLFGFRLRPSPPNGTANKVPKAGAERYPRKLQNWGRPSGGTDFLLARHGRDFSVPIEKAAWCNRQIVVEENPSD